jgi:hypothetical protein
VRVSVAALAVFSWISASKNADIYAQRSANDVIAIPGTFRGTLNDEPLAKPFPIDAAL